MTTPLAEHRLWSRYLHLSKTGSTASDIEHELSSNPDSSIIFQNSSQSQWQTFSEKVILEMTNQLNVGLLFKDIYRYGAEQRKIVARQLRHGASSVPSRMYKYGQYRGELYDSWEYFEKNSSEQVWRYQSGAVFDLVEILITSNEKKSYSVDDGLDQYTIKVTSPIKEQQYDGSNHTILLSTIELAKDYSVIVIRYAIHNKYDFLGDMKLAEYYVSECKKWSYSGPWSTEILLKNIGRLSHLLAHILPVELGNAGIMGWIQRAIALSKGIQLGAYSQRTCKFTKPDPNKNTVISWDFMALVTPDREKYATWFAEYAFIDYVTLSR